MECIVYKFAAWRTADLLIKYSFSDELTIFRHFQDSFFQEHMRTHLFLWQDKIPCLNVPFYLLRFILLYKKIKNAV